MFVLRTARRDVLPTMRSEICHWLALKGLNGPRSPQDASKSAAIFNASTTNHGRSMSNEWDSELDFEIASRLKALKKFPIFQKPGICGRPSGNFLNAEDLEDGSL
jgi:hypothetical protein